MLLNRRRRGGVVASVLILDSGGLPASIEQKHVPLPRHKTLFQKSQFVLPVEYRVSNFVNTALSQPHPKRIP